MKTLCALLILLISSIQEAKALAFIEPIVGYAKGTYVDEYDDEGEQVEDSYDMKGYSYGLRGGLALGFFQLGAEWTKGHYTIDSDESTKIKVTVPALFMGFKFWFVRLYGALATSPKFDDGTGISYDTKSHKYGLSFYAFENVAISLEKTHFDIDQQTVDDLYFDEYNTTSLIISFPFEI